ncbi:MAG TPA: FTR1 family protein [Burkholderiales bacterium]|nr:FTR1 family protein [Burkholderiales bacterium]
MMFSRLRCVSVALLLTIPLAVAAQTTDAGPAQGQMVLHLLDYISVEYPQFVKAGRIVNADEYAEQVEFSAQVADAIGNFAPHPEKDALVASAAILVKLIADKGDSGKVVQRARDLQRGLIKAYRIQIAPARAPDLSGASGLYQSNCVACHGAAGDGNGPQAAALEPRPTNFQDHARQLQRSVYGLYNTISLGVEGTSMPAFGNLRPEERWALAFYVSQFVSTEDERNQGKQLWQRPGMQALFPRLSDLVGTTPAETLRVGDSAYQVLAYLRAHPDVIPTQDSASPLSVAIAKIRESLDLYRQGKHEAAHQAAISAYLEGFELAEASLDRVDSGLRNRIEQDMMAYRNLIKTKVPVEVVEQKGLALVKSLEGAGTLSGDDKLSAAGAFSSAFIIVAREGLEAILVLAAIAAFLIKSGRRDGLKHLHAGWIVALLVGIATWIVSSTLLEISGAQREITEGLTALLAAAVLLYAGYWLHSRSHASRWQSFIGGQVSNALSRRTLFGIALISFLAVYREAFETVLFMQALWVQAEAASRSGLVAGVAAAGVVLAILAWVISRYSARLPLKLFFNLSSLFLAALAVIFAGKGVAALQAAGKLPADALAISGIPSLGIYPNIQGLALQVLLVVLIVASFLYSRAGDNRSSRS